MLVLMVTDYCTKYVLQLMHSAELPMKKIMNEPKITKVASKNYCLYYVV